MYEQIAQYKNVAIEQVIEYKERGANVTVLINYGIGGIKKYTIPLSELSPPEDEPELNATDGALELIAELEIDVNGLIEHYGTKRITTRDVRRYDREHNNE